MNPAIDLTLSEFEAAAEQNGLVVIAGDNPRILHVTRRTMGTGSNYVPVYFSKTTGKVHALMVTRMCTTLGVSVADFIIAAKSATA